MWFLNCLWKARLRRKAVLLLVALFAVGLVAVSYIFFTLCVERHYEKAIVRNTDNAEEKNALLAAENTNYTGIFNLDRFTKSENSHDAWPYTWANLIDTGVIEYYDDRYENLKGTPRDIGFHYEANVYSWNQIRMVYVPPPENGSIYNDSLSIISLNGSLLLQNAKYTGPAWGMRFAYGNNSGYREIQADEIDFSFSESYVVEMKLRYSEVYGPLAAFYSDVYQIIIVNQDFMPILLCVQSEQLIS